MKKIILNLTVLALALASCEKSTDNYLDNIVERTIEFNKKDIKKVDINRPAEFPDYINTLTLATYKEPANSEDPPENEESYREFDFSIVDDGSGSDEVTVIAYVGLNTITAVTNKPPSVCEIGSMTQSEATSLIAVNKARVAQIHYFGKIKDVLFEEGVNGTTSIDMQPGGNRNITTLKLEDDNILNTYDVFVEVTHGVDILSAQFTATNNRIVTYEVNDNVDQGFAVSYDIKYVEIADNTNVVTKNISELTDRGHDTEWDITIVSPVADPLITTTNSILFNFLDLTDGGIKIITK